MAAKNEIITIETDVLVIGGGLAGCMAAIKAAETNVSVTIAEKADTRSSGCAGTGIDHIWGYIPPVHEKMGYTIEDIIESHIKGIAGGFIDQELLYLIVRESYGRILDLESFGLKFRYEDSKAPGKFRVVTQFHSAPTTLNFDGRDLKLKLTREARKRGVRIINRITMTGLLTLYRRSYRGRPGGRNSRRQGLRFQGQGRRHRHRKGQPPDPKSHRGLGQYPGTHK